MELKPIAIVLLSGGMDSATMLAYARETGYRVYALSFKYGQRHAAEIEAARKIALSAGAEKHLIVNAPLDIFGGSVLTTEGRVPKDRTPEQMAFAGVPPTFVPGRNTIFLSYALAWASTVGARHVFIGVNAQDHAGYPDCRKEFIAAFQKMANLATRYETEEFKITIHAPLMHLSKAGILQLAMSMGADLSETVSCYDASADGAACGRCDACVLRRKAFADIGAPDPTRYV